MHKVENYISKKIKLRKISKWKFNTTLILCVVLSYSLLHGQTLYEFCGQPEHLGYTQKLDAIKMLSSGQLDYNFLELNLVTNSNLHEKIENASDNERIEHLVLIGRTPFERNKPITVPSIHKLKHIKSVSLHNIFHPEDFTSIFHQLVQMPNVIALNITDLRFGIEDIPNLKLICKRLHHIVVGQTAKLPDDELIFENLVSLGFFYQPAENHHFVSRLKAPKLNNVAFYIENIDFIGRLTPETLNKINTNWPEIKEIFFTGDYSLTEHHFDALKKFNNLKNLIFNNLNQPTSSIDIPKNIENLKFNNLINSEFIFDSLTELKNLKTLTLKNIKKITYKKPYEKFPKLSELTIINSPNFNSHMFKFDLFKELKNVTITSSNLASVPQNIYNCKKLSTLNLSTNNIENIETKLVYLKMIETIDLSNNKIKILKFEPNKFKKLKYIDVQQNDFHVIPDNLFKIPNLEYLVFGYLKGIGSNNLPDDLKTSNFSKLKVLFWPNLELSQKELEYFLYDTTSFKHLVVKSVERLPVKGWKHKKGEYLDLGEIKYPIIPDDLFYTKIDLIKFSITTENRREYYQISNGVEKKYTQYKFSKIPFDSINNTEFAKYLAKKQQISFDEYELMLKIDSSFTLENVNLSGYCSQLYTKKMYDKALSLIDRLVYKGTLNDSYVENLISTKNSILRKQKRANEIIKSTIILDSIYNYNYGNEIGFYYLKSGNKTLAIEYFKKNIRENYLKVEKLSKYKKKNIYLDLIESLFLVEDYKSIDSLISVCKTKEFDFEEFIPIYHYLQLLRKSVESNITKAQLDELTNIKDNSDLSYLAFWNFDLINQWKEYKSQEIKNRINEIHNVICYQEASTVQDDVQNIEIIEREADVMINEEVISPVEEIIVEDESMEMMDINQEVPALKKYTPK